jgi:hypothetical protein
MENDAKESHSGLVKRQISNHTHVPRQSSRTVKVLVPHMILKGPSAAQQDVVVARFSYPFGDLKRVLGCGRVERRFAAAALCWL